MMKNPILDGKTSGGRVTLKEPDITDLPFIQSLWADEETMAAIGGPVEMTEAQMTRWFQRMVRPGRGTDCFLLIYNESNQPIGEVSFHRLDWTTMQADFNIKVLASHRGRGYGTEAMALLLDYFFRELGGKKMTDDLAQDNLGGQRVLEQFGFRHNPAIQGVYRMEISRQQYLDRPEARDMH